MYIKYEKSLYPVSKEQEEKIRAQIENGGRVSIF